MLVAPKDFAQSSSHAVTSNRLADVPRGDKSGADLARTFRKDTEGKEGTASHPALFTHALEFRGKGQPF